MSNFNPFSLKEKTVLITGASSGIGQATAIECSQMGASVIITGRDEPRLNQTFQQLNSSESTQQHRLVVADLTKQDDLEKLVAEMDVLNGVVLCAGLGYTLPFPYCTREKYDRIFNTNYFATVETMRLLYKKKKIVNEGSIVLIASVGGLNVFSVGYSVYGASKAALTSTMKFCAKEFAKKKIRVNAVTPGMVRTPLIDRGTLTQEQFEQDEKRYPLQRYGRPDDIAHGIIYLLSDASSWVTGTSLIIDGGISI